MMKIVTVVGARPQFIKAAAVSREIGDHSGIKEVIVHTGQHFGKSMSDIFFEEMRIPRPHYELNVNSMGHGAMTGRMLEGIEKVLLEEKPDLVMVYGDTNSTLAGALAARKLHVKIVHVEAGLRSFNIRMPEEVNRILTDRISDILCCPTDSAVKNLKAEGFDAFPCKVAKTGDVMQDAAIFYSRFARRPDVPDIPERDFVLATIHRAENTDDERRLTGILGALSAISEETPVVVPLHPRTKSKLAQLGLSKAAGLRIIEPVGYLEMVWLLQACRMVMTDSGGLQKEAYFFRKPCVTLRDETEWVELVEQGVNMLAGAERDGIIQSYHQIASGDLSRLDFDSEMYGGGAAVAKILETIVLASKEWK